MTAQPIHSSFSEPWTPIAGSSQELVLASKCDITLYTGTRGPGKTDTQLYKFKRNVGIGYGMYWRGIIFDREYKNLDDIVNKSKRWFYRYDDGARWYSSKSDYKWVWPTGEELLIRAVKDEKDYWDYHGQEFPYVAWNEITKYPTSALFDAMMSINRSSFTPEKDTPYDTRIVDVNNNVICDRDQGIFLPNIPLEIMATTNPYGVGHAWVKRRFIDPADYGQILKHDVEVFDPRQQKDVIVTKTQVTIFGNYRENIYLDAKYVAGLKENSNENQRKAWFTGSWDIVVGGAFDDVWRRDIHILPRFKIPENWTINRSLDWGSTKPYSVGWWALANGEEIELPNGRVFCPQPGSLIQIAELYGSKEIGSNKGLKQGSADVAEAIVTKEKDMLLKGWIETQPWRGPADNSIAAVNDPSTDTTAAAMAKKGVSWTESDKAKGARTIGLQLMRDRLEAAVKGEGPGLYFMVNCRASIATIPILPRDEDKEDDVDTDAEDHAYDMVRYRVLSAGRVMAKSINVSFPR